MNTDSTRAMPTAQSGDDVLLYLVGLLAGAQTPVIALQVESGFAVPGALEIGDNVTCLIALQVESGWSVRIATDSTKAMPTAQSGDSVELYFVGATTGHQTAVIGLQVQSGFVIVQENVIGGLRTCVISLQVQGGLTVALLTDSTEAMPTAQAGGSVELAFVTSTAGHETCVVGLQVQSGFKVEGKEIEGLQTCVIALQVPVCDAVEWGDGTEWGDDTEWGGAWFTDIAGTVEGHVTPVIGLQVESGFTPTTTLIEGVETLVISLQVQSGFELVAKLIEGVETPVIGLQVEAGLFLRDRTPVRTFTAKTRTFAFSAKERTFTYNAKTRAFTYTAKDQ